MSTDQSTERLLILLELTKLVDQLQKAAYAMGEHDLAYHCLAQGMVNGVQAAMDVIKSMEPVPA